MKKKRLDRDLKWGFQHFPYYQLRVDTEAFHGLACLICLTDGKTICWQLPRAGSVPVAGAGMCWLQLIPDGQQRLITAKYLPDGEISVWYVDVIDHVEYDADGVAVFADLYLDVYFTPQGDLIIDDRDELNAALAGGDITQSQHDLALAECDGILADLCANPAATAALCNSVLQHLKQLIAAGEKPFKEGPER